jgi:hypothetical protein
MKRYILIFVAVAMATAMSVTARPGPAAAEDAASAQITFYVR